MLRYIFINKIINKRPQGHLVFRRTGNPEVPLLDLHYSSATFPIVLFLLSFTFSGNLLLKDSGAVKKLRATGSLFFLLSLLLWPDSTVGPRCHSVEPKYHLRTNS